MNKKEIIGNKKPISVSAYIELVNEGLKKFDARIIGEVSEFKPKNGYIFFTLKDKDENGVISCFIWKSNYKLLGVELKEGLEVIISGYLYIYPKSGRLHFQTSTIELVGEGALKKAYEKLKKKLTEEGIFEKERKRPIPDYVQHIGVITSQTGAVTHDFTANLGKFGFKIKMIDSRVEGVKAVKDLLSSIESFKKQNIEVLIIMRGGGSLESLMAFNNESLVREVADFPVPVIAAIGHEKDIPLMSLAADAMPSTPTAAANLLSESWKEAQYKVERYERKIIGLYSKQLSETNSFLNEFIYKIKEKFSAILSKYKEIENKLKFSLSKIHNALILNRRDVMSISRSIFKDFSTNLNNLQYEIESIDFYSKFDTELATKKKDITNYSKSILKDFASTLETIKYNINNIEKIIILNNPERQLKLGYSIARHNGKLIKSVKSVKIGEDMDVQVSDGSIQSKIKNINKK